ncbi:MAG TPA: DUF3489 domain-containing protein [Rickettsiales bacterium]|nr:DUF3489 domain-containing protein [Rickettsiales bacterium]
MKQNTKPKATVATKIKSVESTVATAQKKAEVSEIVPAKAVVKTKTRATGPAKPTQDNVSRPGSKQTIIIDMLKAPKGATVAELAEATGWQKHSVQGAMSGALKKKLGLTITSEKDEKRGRVYRITGERA